MSSKQRSDRERFLDQVLAESPLSRIAAGGSIPSVELPSFDGLTFEVPEPAELTDDELSERLTQVLYTASPRKPRPMGSPVGPDDELIVDCVAYCGGELLPFLVREGLTLTPAFETSLSELRVKLVGAPVGSVQVVEHQVPSDYPLEQLRDLPAFFSVRINSASEVELLDINSPEFLQTLKLGDSLPDVVDALTKSFAEEDRVANFSVAFADLMVELAARANLEIPEGLIDKEVGRRWRIVEGEFLNRVQTPLEQQDIAVEAWLETPEIREDCERSLKVTIMLRSILERDKSLASQSQLKALWNQLMTQAGVDPEIVRADLQKRGDVDLNRRIVESLLYMRAVEDVLSRVTRPGN